MTTVVTGNCGVGFAPVRPGDHEALIKVMEGVEDIPELVMAKGIKPAILSEQAIDDPQPLNNMLANAVNEMFELTNPVDYVSQPGDSLVECAKAAGRDPDQYLYDVLLKDEGRNIVYMPGANFVGYSLDAAREMIASGYTVLGLGDGERTTASSATPAFRLSRLPTGSATPHRSRASSSSGWSPN